MNKKKSPTMKDVAREAGVSLGTVSNVFNGGSVSPSYKERVEEAAKKLGYTINRYARGLKTSETHVIAFVCPGTDHPFFGDLTNYINKALADRGYRMLLAVTQFIPDMEQRCIRLVSENKVDGIIALTYNPELQLEESIPFVSIDRQCSPTAPCVSSDNYSGGQLAAQKLYELGSRQLLFLSIAPKISGEPDTRRYGFESWCRASHVPFESVVIPDTDGFRPFLNILKARIRDGKPDFDGIFCSTDKLAYVVLRMLKELGVSVPGQVQIIGYDGINMFGDPVMPCVSSICQPVREMAETAVSTLLSRGRPSMPTLICLPVTYRAGGTTRDREELAFIYER